jgi:hypothetical protein
MGFHYLAFGSMRNWVPLAVRHGIDLQYARRALQIAAVGIATAPFRAYEAALHSRSDQADFQSPVFILGHWRSGTTFLENLLACDESFGCVSRFQMVTPHLLFTCPSLLRRLWIATAPTTRAPDHMHWPPETAEEDEWAMAVASRHSYYHSFFFPREHDHYLHAYVLFDRGTDTAEQWSAAYRKLIDKFARYHVGRRLILKSPANTARIPELLQLFPDAQFIHLVRNPYSVFSSQLATVRIVLANAQLQRTSEEKIEENVIAAYEAVMGRYLEYRHLIPEQNLLEVRYEDLRSRPAGSVDSIYRHFDWPRADAARSNLDAYLDVVKGHHAGRTPLSADQADRVARRWGFAFDTWKYSPQQSAA